MGHTTKTATFARRQMIADQRRADRMAAQDDICYHDLAVEKARKLADLMGYDEYCAWADEIITPENDVRLDYWQWYKGQVEIMLEAQQSQLHLHRGAEIARELGIQVDACAHEHTVVDSRNPSGEPDGWVDELVCTDCMEVLP